MLLWQTLLCNEEYQSFNMTKKNPALTINDLARIPLHMQEQDSDGVDKWANPSYESFRPNNIFSVNYVEMEDRPTLNPIATLRRDLNGSLNIPFVAAMVVDSFHKMEDQTPLTPTEMALLQIVFPNEYPSDLEPMQVQMLTQLSETEKEQLIELVEGYLHQESDYAGGNGGGHAIPGLRVRT